MSEYKVKQTPIVYQGVTHDPGTVLNLTDEEAANIGTDLVEPVTAAPEAEGTEPEGQPEGEATQPQPEGASQPEGGAQTETEPTQPEAQPEGQPEGEASGSSES